MANTFNRVKGFHGLFDLNNDKYDLSTFSSGYPTDKIDDDSVLFIESCDSDINKYVFEYKITKAGICFTYAKHKLWGVFDSVSGIQEYSISYNLNGGLDSGCGLPSLESISSGVSYIIKDLSDNSKVTKTGYLLKLDNNNKVIWTCSGSTITAGDSITVNSSKIFYLTWDPITYKVRFNANCSASSGTMSDETFNFGLSKLLTANNFSRSGNTVTFDSLEGSECSSQILSYSFAGWSDSLSSSEVKYTNLLSVLNLSSTNNGIINLYALWLGGLITLPTTTRTGYNFDGWYTLATGGDRIGGAGSNYTPTSDVTLYAHWSEEFTATYEAKWIRSVVPLPGDDPDTTTYSISGKNWTDVSENIDNSVLTINCQAVGGSSKAYMVFRTNDPDISSVKLSGLPVTVLKTTDTYKLFYLGLLTTTNSQFTLE